MIFIICSNLVHVFLGSIYRVMAVMVLSDLFVPACQVSATQEDFILLGEVLAKSEVAAVRI